MNNQPSSSSSNFENRIDRIVTEKSRIEVVLGETLPEADSASDAEVRQQMEDARRRQMEERERFLKRYQTAIMAFLGAMLQNSEAVSDVWERFVDKWLTGKLKSYDSKLMFRTYLKQVLRNDVYAYWEKQSRQRDQGPDRLSSAVDYPDERETIASSAFDLNLQEAVLQRAMEAVRQEGSDYYVVLTLLTQAVADDAEHPSTAEIAKRLSAVNGSRVSDDSAKKTKQRAREMLSQKIIEQVGLLNGTDSLPEIETALIDLGMIQYCRKFLKRMRET